MVACGGETSAYASVEADRRALEEDGGLQDPLEDVGQRKVRNHHVRARNEVCVQRRGALRVKEYPNAKRAQKAAGDGAVPGFSTNTPATFAMKLPCESMAPYTAKREEEKEKEEEKGKRLPR